MSCSFRPFFCNVCTTFRLATPGQRLSQCKKKYPSSFSTYFTPVVHTNDDPLCWNLKLWGNFDFFTFLFLNIAKNDSKNYGFYHFWQEWPKTRKNSLSQKNCMIVVLFGLFHEFFWFWAFGSFLADFPEPIFVFLTFGGQKFKNWKIS